MTLLPNIDMSFEGFKSNLSPVSSGAQIFSYYRPADDIASHRPLLVLIHGYPQNHTMWKDFVTLLPRQWSLFVVDLPGYGQSLKTDPTGSCLAFSKRAMAKDIVEAVDLVHPQADKIVAYGHDRGGRVAYRMALDFSERVVGLAVLDIIPTVYMWHSMRPDNDHKETRLSNHWIFLSSPKPLPETLIGNNPEWYYTWIMSAWGPEGGEKPAWIVDAVKPYTDSQRASERISAACEDYRAGATVDVDHDREQGIDPASDQKQVFKIPVLDLASIHLRRRHEVDRIWTRLVGKELLQSYQIGGEGTGHFFVNEEPVETAARTTAWLEQYWG